jgi:hypothetical protein
MTTRARLVTLIVPLAALAGCSGGGSAPEPAPQSRAVAVTLSVTGAGAVPVHALDVTLALPAGGTVANEAASGRVSASALAGRGGAARAVVEARFAPGGARPTVRLLLASDTALGDGEVVAVKATVRGAAVPAPSAFATSAVTVAGPDGAPVPGAAVAVTGVAAAQ